jgi:hypothetical protein
MKKPPARNKRIMKFYKGASRYQKISLIVVVAVVAGMGIYTLLASHAATPYAAVTAGSGVKTGAATLQSDGSVQFGTVSTGGGGGSNKGVPFIGINDMGPSGAWVSQVTDQLQGDGFLWNRVDVAGSSYHSGTEVDASLNRGLNVVMILPMSASSAMTWMNAYTHFGSRVVFEFGNEPYFNGSGGSPGCGAAGTYAQAYKAAYDAKHSAGIPQPLLFVTNGDPFGCGNWLTDAVNTVPSLQVDAFSAHPYGKDTDNVGNCSYGVQAFFCEHTNAVNHGFTNTPWYITEFGYTINPNEAGHARYATNYATQASQLTASYNDLIQYGDGVKGTWLKGILWYQVHDDGTGWFGLLTAPPSTVTGVDASGEPAGSKAGSAALPISLRPSYFALKTFLTNH